MFSACKWIFSWFSLSSRSALPLLTDSFDLWIMALSADSKSSLLFVFHALAQHELTVFAVVPDSVLTFSVRKWFFSLKFLWARGQPELTLATNVIIEFSMFLWKMCSLKHKVLCEYCIPFVQLYYILTSDFTEGTLELYLVIIIFCFRLLNNSLVALWYYPSSTITVCESYYTQFVVILILNLT